jgi:hypothetical protein
MERKKHGVTRLTRQDLVNDPIATRWLFFLLHHFDFKKKIDPDNLVKTRNPDLEPGRV